MYASVIEELFTSTGNGKFNMVDYFRDMSHGVLDLSGSQVFGWYTLNKKRSEYTGSGVNQQGRTDLINWARQAAIDDKKDLSKFVNVVVCMNVGTDLFGGGAGVVCDDSRSVNGMTSMSPSLLGQEMGHGYGLAHSRADGSTADYMDQWDVMSTAGAFMAAHPNFTEVDVRGNPVFLTGPGLNAANMASREWLDESRVWMTTNRGFDTVVKLRPLHRPDLPGFLAARFGNYFIEFRVRERWDAGIPRPAVLIHRLEDSISYLMSANDGQQDLVAGSVFGTVDPSNPILAPFIAVNRVEVIEINPEQRFATVRLIHRPAFEEPSLGPGIVFGGIAHGGNGILILPGGTVKPIPPHSPLYQVLEQIAAYQSSASIASAPIRDVVRKEALSAIVGLAESQLRTIQAFRQPTLPLQRQERQDKSTR